uniref:Uncharacterized protein n=1 Tax=Anguilla anguilla TaxID=7936 RepID=A0A0E9V3F7_ANGAN
MGHYSKKCFSLWVAFSFCVTTTT